MEYFKLSSFLFLIIYFLFVFTLPTQHPNNSANSYLIQTTDTHFSVPNPEERERENFSLFLIHFSSLFQLLLISFPQKTPGIDSTTISQANHFFYILLPTKYIYLFIYLLSCRQYQVESNQNQLKLKT